MIGRLSETDLARKLRTFPAVLVVGPRQCGKTTLVRARLRGWNHLDLERPADLAALSSDLQGFLERTPRRLAVDEAQRLPELFPALRHAIDADRRPGRFVLTGSADPRLIRTVQESLTGRVGVLELTPFLLSELRGRPAWLRQLWFWGGFPPVYPLRAGAQKADWLANYLASVLERDIPALGFRLPPLRLLRLCQMLAHVHGGLLNLSELGASLSLSYHTVSHHLDVLEGAFLVRRLQPYYANVGKRLTKSPKLYIRDTGLLHHLAGLTEPHQLDGWHRRGASWEGLLVEEVIRKFSIAFPATRPYFWRTQAGAEVDLLLETGGTKLAFEVKLGSAPAAQSLQALRQCLLDLGLRRGYVLYGGSDRVEVGGGIILLPWREVLEPSFAASVLRR